MTQQPRTPSHSHDIVDGRTWDFCGACGTLSESIDAKRVDIIKEPKRHDHEWRDVGGGYAECECGAFGTLDWTWDR